MTGPVVRRSIWGLVGSIAMKTSAARPVLWDDKSYSLSTSSLDLSYPEGLGRERASVQIQRRENSNSSTIGTVSIVVPVVVVTLFAIMMLVIQVQRRPKWNSFVRRLFSRRALAPVATEGSSTPMSTVAGSNQAENGTTNPSESTSPTQAEINMRDARRNLAAERERRRTHGSLRSVRTLPRYREDLDESEMALMKGEAADEEDITATSTFRRTSTDSFHSNPDESLLNHIALPAEHPAGDSVMGRNRGQSVSTVLTTTTMMSDGSRSEDQADGSMSTQHLIPTNGWGEVPLYTEQGTPPTVLPSDNPSSAAHSSTVEFLTTITSEDTTNLDRPGRQSGYRAFFSRVNAGRTARQAGDHQTLSVDDVHSNTGTHGTRTEVRSGNHQSRHPYQQHRSRNSTSSIDTGGGLGNSFRSSNVSLLLHPTTSRSSVDMRTRLMSPSTLSISAPLPESVVRGSVYEVPRSGLTKDQMKFISSTENLNKYAIPFGESASRASFDRRRSMEHNAPPPAFDPTSEGPSISGIDGLDPPVLPSPSLASASPDPSLSDLPETSSSSQVLTELTSPSSHLDAGPPKDHLVADSSESALKTLDDPSSSTIPTTSTKRLDPSPEDFLGVDFTFSPFSSPEPSSTSATALAPILPTSPTSPISPTTTTMTSFARERDENAPKLATTPVSIEVVPPTPVSVLGSARSFA